MSSFPSGDRQPHVSLVTCRRWPTLSPSDQCYANALRAMGVQVNVGAWNSADDQDGFHAADLVVIRGSWDYHDDTTAYRDWLRALSGRGINVLNGPATINRFLNKTAFAELADGDIIVPGWHVCPPDYASVARVLLDEQWTRAVLKPVSGASGRGVQLATLETLVEALTAVVADVGERDLVVQEFIPEIAEGETQFVLFDGTVSHAVLKRPRQGEFRTNSAFAPTVQLLEPLPPATARIEALVQRAAAQALYARVDVAMRGHTPILLEFEVNEPGLWLDVAPPSAAERFARATVKRLVLDAGPR